MSATAERSSGGLAKRAGPPGGIARLLWRRPWLRGLATLSPPLAWFLVIYLASLLVMLLTAFWTVNPFTNLMQHSFSTANFSTLVSSSSGSAWTS